LAFWIAVFAVASPLSSKLNSAQENDASAWLPTNAESTQVDELAKQFTPSDVIPTLVVYERPGGPVTAADRAKAAADVQRLAGVRDVSGKILGPIPSKDGHALQLVVPVKVATEGSDWEQISPRIEEMRSIARSGAGDLGVYVTGPGGYFADFAGVFSGFDTTLLYFTAAIVMVILAFPLWTFVFLVALGTDYNIFLMTRVQEEAKRHGTRRGALIGLAATGGVITSAGVVLAGTFAALGSLPLVSITEIGIAVAFGVLLDTFIVRSVLVTSLNLDVGRWIWWPSGLHRKQDVEPGELQDEREAVTLAAPRT